MWATLAQRALEPNNIAHSREEKKIRSLRSEDVLVTPNFRENHRGRRGGSELRHFQGNRPIFSILATDTATAAPQDRQHERRTSV